MTPGMELNNVDNIFVICCKRPTGNGLFQNQPQTSYEKDPQK